MGESCIARVQISYVKPFPNQVTASSMNYKHLQTRVNSWKLTIDAPLVIRVVHALVQYFQGTSQVWLKRMSWKHSIINRISFVSLTSNSIKTISTRATARMTPSLTKNIDSNSRRSIAFAVPLQRNLKAVYAMPDSGISLYPLTNTNSITRQ